MGVKTGIAWTESTWNPVRGCSKVSDGCKNCYAMSVAYRFSGPGQPYDGLAKQVGGKAEWTNRVMLVEEHLLDPIRWTKPRRIFTNSMSDIFHKDVPVEYLDRIYAVMALSPQHTFQNLTKRPERRRGYLSNPLAEVRVAETALEISKQLPKKQQEAFTQKIRWLKLPGIRYVPCGLTEWPLPNVWEGTSVENQATADLRIPELLQTPAAVRWVSYEPALGLVDFSAFLESYELGELPQDENGHAASVYSDILDWIVVGGESGPNARPFDITWARETVQQCKAANVPVFVKQLGAVPFERKLYGPEYGPCVTADFFLSLHDKKGGNMEEWPEDLRVREFPE